MIFAIEAATLLLPKYYDIDNHFKNKIYMFVYGLAVRRSANKPLRK